MSSHDSRIRTMLSSRRDLLRALGLAGGVALLGPLATRGGSMAHAAVASPMAGAGVLLELDGSYSPAEAADGGNAFAEVGAEPPQDSVLRKHLTAVRYEDLVVQVPLGLAAAPLVSWIGVSLQNGAVPKSGALVYVDYTGKEMRRLEFQNAVITEVTLPACDASSAKDRGDLTLRLVPETTRLAGASGKTASAAFGKSQRLMTSMFRMNVQGLENACKSIRSVSAPSAKRPLLRSGGLEKVSKTAAGLLDCAPISIVLAERDAGPFYMWFSEFVLKGNVNNGERPGRLEFLAPTIGTVLATVDFGNLGIVRYAPLSPSAESAQGISGHAGSGGNVQVDMFCETLSLTVA
jgi:hypothetical protein